MPTKKSKCGKKKCSPKQLAALKKGRAKRAANLKKKNRK